MPDKIELKDVLDRIDEWVDAPTQAGLSRLKLSYRTERGRLVTLEIDRVTALGDEP